MDEAVSVVMSSLKNRKTGAFVYPGEKLGVIEEFLAGSGTYVENGELFSSSTGRLSLDLSRKEISVISQTHSPRIPKVGSVVVGQVVAASEKTATIRIDQIDDVKLGTSFIGIIHVSDVGRTYTRNLTDMVKVGDFIRAKVISTKNREFHLSTREDMLGVVKAACVICGQVLILQRNGLRCPNCGSIARRKVAGDYGRQSSGWLM
jgi:exosome complex component CSL4